MRRSPSLGLIFGVTFAFAVTLLYTTSPSMQWYLVIPVFIGALLVALVIVKIISLLFSR